jgi:MerR family transcriptional regulator, light-induced transcriptional regulator
MSSFTQSGLVHESGAHESSRFEGWLGDDVYSPPEGETALRPSDEAHRDAVELRLAVLARAIEHEIIPRLMMAHRMPNACLTLPDVPVQRVSLEDVQQFAKLVLSPDENVSQACVEAMRARGISVETIYLDLLAPVARYLGELWEQDLCDFTEVTLGLGRLQQVLRELSPAFGQSNDRPTNGLRVLLLPGPGEQHTFGLVMVAEFFRRAGWDVAGGPWEAGADPVVMVKRERFDIVGFSLANEAHLAELGECVRNVRKASLNTELGIIVGGPAFALNPEYVEQVHADAAVNNGGKAPDLAEKLVANLSKRG